MLENVFFFLSITVFDHQTNFFSCTHSCSVLPWQSVQKGGGKSWLFSQRIWKLIQSLSDHCSLNTRAPFDLWESTSWGELWISEESKIQLFSMCHQCTEQWSNVPSQTPDVTFGTPQSSSAENRGEQSWILERRAQGELQGWLLLCGQHPAPSIAFQGHWNYRIVLGWQAYFVRFSVWNCLIDPQKLGRLGWGFANLFPCFQNRKLVLV